MNRPNQLTRRLLSGVLCSLVTASAVIMAQSQRPRLVVNIVVDQLRTDYLEYLRPLFGDKGFGRLMRQGVYMRDVDFKAAHLDAPSAAAMLATGAYPSQTGVPAAETYDAATGQPRAALTDPDVPGNFTSDTYSPASLRLSTVSDEVAIDGGGLGAVYSVAADPRVAVAMAGHAGNGAVWIDPNTGKWAGSTYYRDFPQAASQRNYRADLTSRLDTMRWRPALKADRYPGIPSQISQYAFSYTFPRSERDVYRKFISSPLSNREVTDLAIECLQSMRLGDRGQAVDMLGIGLTAAPFAYASDADSRMELQDTYVRLDGDLQRLFEAIDRGPGMDNTLVVLSSTGYYADERPDDGRYRIPGGEFSTRRALSLLNSYLSAKYGNGDYVSGYHNGRIYLEHKQFEKQRTDVAAAAGDACAFLRRMSGVADARTVDEVLDDNSGRLEALRLSIDPHEGGDIALTFTPGWTVSDDRRYPPVKKQVRTHAVSTPAFIMGSSVTPRVIDTPVDAAAMAPTVCGTLRIRSPNGAAARPLNL